MAEKKELRLGLVIKPWGTLAAIGVRDGEGFCMFIDEEGVVSLIPTDCVLLHMNAEP